MTEQQKGSQRQHLAGGRPWRWVFESMRAAQEPGSLIPSLLVLSPNIVDCCAELPPQEVTDDISLIVQAVSDRWLPIDSAEAARICRLTCIFVRNVLQRLQLAFNEELRLALLHFFQGTITSASAVILLGEDGGAEAGRAKVEAVATLGKFLQEAHNGGSLSMDDVSEAVLFLSGLITYPVTPAPALLSTARSDSEGHHGSNVDEMELQRLTFVVMGSLISQARPLVSGETWTIAIQALRVILDSLASKKALVKDFAASRYYLDLLRCVYILVSEPEDRLKEHVGAFMRVLQMFFRYGLKVSQGEAASSSSNRWEEEKDMNLPLNHHWKEGFEFSINDGSVCMPDSANLFSFDTYESASDAPVEDAFRDKSSELRMYSISAIQAMAKADREGFQKCLDFLLLADNTVQPGSDEATLLTVLRFEPLTKVRMAAVSTLAVMLEFPMYPCHQDADYLGNVRKGLSGSQRQIFFELQTGLIHVILNEKHKDTLVATLKALSRYVATTPFSQLPSKLLPNLALSVSKRLRESNYFFNQSCVSVAAIACLKSSLSIPPSSTQLCDVYSKDARTGPSNLIVSPSLLVDLITCSQPPAPSTVQVEAILALKAAAHNYPGLVTPYWDDIFKVLVRIIDSGSENRSVASDDANLLSSAFTKTVSPSGLVPSSRLSDDELVQSAIELLDELLRVASDFESPREDLDDITLKSQLPDTPEAPKILCSPKFVAHNNSTTSDSMVSEQSEEDGSLKWTLALERLLPGVLRHSSPMVRGAGLSCFAGLTPAVFCSLPAPKQEFILSAIMRASQYDDTPAVRSVACRAVGVIAGFPQVSKRYKRSNFY